VLKRSINNINNREVPEIKVVVVSRKSNNVDEELCQGKKTSSTKNKE
jgi:hypothetical protein